MLLWLFFLLLVKSQLIIHPYFVFYLYCFLFLLDISRFRFYLLVVYLYSHFRFCHLLLFHLTDLESLNHWMSLILLHLQLYCFLLYFGLLLLKYFLLHHIHFHYNLLFLILLYLHFLFDMYMLFYFHLHHQQHHKYQQNQKIPLEIFMKMEVGQIRKYMQNFQVTI